MLYLEKKNSYGFTIIETVVIVAIITALSGVVLFNFGGLNQGAALNRSSRELALAIRKVQNMTLAVTQITVGNPPTPQIPLAVGIQFTQNPSSYVLFADINKDNIFESGLGEQIGSPVVFERGIKINSLTAFSGLSATAFPAALIIFHAPEAAITFNDIAGNPIGDKLEIVLAAPSGNKRTITVRTSGQISIK